MLLTCNPVIHEKKLSSSDTAISESKVREVPDILTIVDPIINKAEHKWFPLSLIAVIWEMFEIAEFG